MKKCGLIINPIAGMGGSVGLKGTDGLEILHQARKLGAIPRAQDRTLAALTLLAQLKDQIDLITCAGPMGEFIARQSGFSPQVIYVPPQTEITVAGDTQKAAQCMVEAKADLLLFAGGDGTARDIYQAIQGTLVSIGIPAGVKIHSAVFAENPKKAGELAFLYLQNRIRNIIEAEVIDINEVLYRQGILSTDLCGYLRIPFHRRLVQNIKASTPCSEQYNQEEIASHVIEEMSEDYFYLVGTGTSCRAVMEKMKLEKTLLGIDLVQGKRLAGMDLRESQILEMIKDRPVKIIVTPIGGQGYIFGRGNQQISPTVIKQVGKGNIIIIAGKKKIESLHGRPLLVDTGDEMVNQMLTGYFKIITGYHELIVYRIST